MTKPPIKIGQLGIGYWGPNILRNLVSNPAFDVRRVVDLSEERLAFVRGKYPKVEVSSDPASVLEDKSISAVAITTPAGTHFSLAMQALRSGKHILVEKPMACTPAEVEQIAMEARSRNLVAMVGHTFLYSPAVLCLKQLIDSGELGQVRYLYCQRLNLGRVRSDIDALWNFAPHDISIIQYLFGDPMPIHVNHCGMDYIQRGIQDVAFTTLTYPNKVLANIHVSWLDPNRTRKITVVGSDRMAVYDDTAKNKISVYDKGIDRFAVLGQDMDYDTTTRTSYSARSGNVLTPNFEDREPLGEEIAHFADCIQNGTECRTGPEHALRVVKILTMCRPETKIITYEEETARESENSTSRDQSNLTLR